MTQDKTFHLSKNRIHFIVFIILFFYILVGMGIDLLAPSLPAISSSLHASKIFSKNLITIFLVGYSLGSFFSGFLSDALGRRKLIILGLSIFVIASFLPIIYPNTTLLLGSRFFQGLGLATFSVVARALFSDVLEPDELMRVAIWLSMVWGIGPILGPVIGGYLQYYFNWPACFYFFTIFSVMALVASVAFIPETHFKRQSLNIKPIGKNLITIVSHGPFVGFSMLMGLSYSLIIVFNTLGPFLIQQHFGHTSIYFGHLALWMGLVFLIATLLGRYLLKYFSAEKILLISIIFFLLLGLITVLVAYFNNSVWIAAFATACAFLETGIVYPICLGKGMSLFRHLAGSGTAVLILIHMSISSLTSLVMSFVHANNAVSLVWVYVVLMVLIAIIFFTKISSSKRA